jgi:hypothetical protein
VLIRLAVVIEVQSKRVYGAEESGKEPSEEVDRCDGHADAKQDASHDFLRAAFTEGEGQPSDHNGDEREATSNGGCERGHQNIDGVLPGRSTGCLGEDCCGDE